MPTDPDSRCVNEFELIGRCFRGRTTRRPGTVLGIGDDAALLDTGDRVLDHARATAAFGGSSDAAGTARHVFCAALVRLAAQGVTPRWATLGLTLEAGESDWIVSFSRAAVAVCDACEVELIGGDTTGGPGRATVFALGTRCAHSRRTVPQPSAAPAKARVPLATAHASEHAIADLVSACTDLAAGGARIRCREVPGMCDDAGPVGLELVVQSDAAVMDALRTAADRLHPESKRLKSND